MVSFFSKCPKCGSMVVTGNPCPECGPTDEPAAETDIQEGAPGDVAKVKRGGSSLVEEYQRRQEMHTRNYTIYMLLMAGTGVLGMPSAICWFFFIFRGNVFAAILLIPLNLGLLVLGYLVKAGKAIFPIEVNCPSCDTRVDEIGLNSGGTCPGCNVRLR